MLSRYRLWMVAMFKNCAQHIYKEGLAEQRRNISEELLQENKDKLIIFTLLYLSIKNIYIGNAKFKSQLLCT